ncbi:hypothetical protein, unlikely [Trypanosoma brucei gambiense DAL972]|uniref:Uncharacterized protein n=1 Tax=Trypanosoma brucei gambiense (strain MHOM/CI/86/DAL972) TaxID=679716 RepID=D0A7T0_TRYB9|nr:hypothetical protein, unlikely [Trypanosoma brucei gambiense DAL972]CBH17731.1 hypothetical protein, unlikely [Trypanosoma brucei gambiense DAL972]|eukprot:XP_011779995.1 hypothetical protein, unlikely [Trypanosoma brucei gambiense DAL972]
MKLRRRHHTQSEGSLLPRHFYFLLRTLSCTPIRLSCKRCTVISLWCDVNKVQSHTILQTNKRKLQNYHQLNSTDYTVDAAKTPAAGKKNRSGTILSGSLQNCSSPRNAPNIVKK